MKTTLNSLKRKFPLMVAFGFILGSMPAFSYSATDGSFIVADRGRDKGPARSNQRATPNRGRSEARPAARDNRRGGAVRQDNRSRRNAAPARARDDRRRR